MVQGRPNPPPRGTARGGHRGGHRHQNGLNSQTPEPMVTTTVEHRSGQGGVSNPLIVGADPSSTVKNGSSQLPSQVLLDDDCLTEPEEYTEEKKLSPPPSPPSTKNTGLSNVPQHGSGLNQSVAKHSGKMAEPKGSKEVKQVDTAASKVALSNTTTQPNVTPTQRYVPKQEPVYVIERNPRNKRKTVITQKHQDPPAEPRNNFVNTNTNHNHRHKPDVANGRSDEKPNRQANKQPEGRRSNHRESVKPTTTFDMDNDFPPLAKSSSSSSSTNRTPQADVKSSASIERERTLTQQEFDKLAETPASSVEPEEVVEAAVADDFDPTKEVIPSNEADGLPENTDHELEQVEPTADRNKPRAQSVEANVASATTPPVTQSPRATSHEPKVGLPDPPTPVQSVKADEKDAQLLSNPVVQDAPTAVTHPTSRGRQDNKNASKPKESPKAWRGSNKPKHSRLGASQKPADVTPSAKMGPVVSEDVVQPVPSAQEPAKKKPVAKGSVAPVSSAPEPAKNPVVVEDAVLPESLPPEPAKGVTSFEELRNALKKEIGTSDKPKSIPVTPVTPTVTPVNLPVSTSSSMALSDGIPLTSSVSQVTSDIASSVSRVPSDITSVSRVTSDVTSVTSATSYASSDHLSGGAVRLGPPTKNPSDPVVISRVNFSRQNSYSPPNKQERYGRSERRSTVDESAQPESRGHSRQGYRRGVPSGRQHREHRRSNENRSGYFPNQYSMPQMPQPVNVEGLYNPAPGYGTYQPPHPQAYRVPPRPMYPPMSMMHNLPANFPMPPPQFMGHMPQPPPQMNPQVHMMQNRVARSDTSSNSGSTGIPNRTPPNGPNLSPPNESRDSTPRIQPGIPAGPPPIYDPRYLQVPVLPMETITMTSELQGLLRSLLRLLPHEGVFFANIIDNVGRTSRQVRVILHDNNPFALQGMSIPMFLRPNIGEPSGNANSMVIGQLYEESGVTAPFKHTFFAKHEFPEDAPPGMVPLINHYPVKSFDLAIPEGLGIANLPNVIGNAVVLDNDVRPNPPENLPKPPTAEAGASSSSDTASESCDPNLR